MDTKEIFNIQGSVGANYVRQYKDTSFNYVALITIENILVEEILKYFRTLQELNRYKETTDVIVAYNKETESQHVIVVEAGFQSTSTETISKSGQNIDVQIGVEDFREFRQRTGTWEFNINFKIRSTTRAAVAILADNLFIGLQTDIFESLRRRSITISFNRVKMSNLITPRKIAGDVQVYEIVFDIASISVPWVLLTELNGEIIKRLDYTMQSSDTDTDHSYISFFELLLPEEDASIDTETSSEVLFSWEAAITATSYRLQITDLDSNTIVFDEASIEATSKTLPIENLSPDRNYSWKVIASDGESNLDSSTVRNFTTAAVPIPDSPTLLSPSNSAVDISLTTSLDWTDVDGALTYHLQIATDSNFNTTVVDESGLVLSTYTVSNGVLSNSIAYYWRVSSVNGSGESSWSTVRNFTTAAAIPVLGAFDLLLPLNNSEVDINSPNLNLSWEESTNATSYEVKIYEDIILYNNIYDSREALDRYIYYNFKYIVTIPNISGTVYILDVRKIVSYAIENNNIDLTILFDDSSLLTITCENSIHAERHYACLHNIYKGYHVYNDFLGTRIMVNEGESITDAITSASLGSMVVVNPGAYNQNIRLKNGVDIFFRPGVTLQSSNNAQNGLFTDNNVSVICNIYGHPSVNVEDTELISLYGESSEVYIEVEDIVHFSTSCCTFISSHLDSITKLHVKGRKLTSTQKLGNLGIHDYDGHGGIYLDYDFIEINGINKNLFYGFTNPQTVPGTYQPIFIFRNMFVSSSTIVTIAADDTYVSSIFIFINCRFENTSNNPSAAIVYFSNQIASGLPQYAYYYNTFFEQLNGVPIYSDYAINNYSYGRNRTKLAKAALVTLLGPGELIVDSNLSISAVTPGDITAIENKINNYTYQDGEKLVFNNLPDTIVFDEASIEATSKTLPIENLSPDRNYSWKVIASDILDSLDSSTVRNFTTGSLSPPPDIDYYVQTDNYITDSNSNDRGWLTAYEASTAMREVLKTGDNYKYWQTVPTVDSLYYFDVRRMTGAATSTTNTIVVPFPSGNLSIVTLTNQIAIDLKNDINSCRESAIFDPNTCSASVTTYAGLISALSTATVGQTIRITGSFTATNSIVLKDGVNLYVDDGVIVTINIDDNLFTDGGVQCICSILGFGKFVFTNISSQKTIINTNFGTTNIWLDFREINYLGNFAPFYTQITRGGIYRVKGKLLNSSFRLFDSDGDNPLISLDIVTVTTDYEFMYPATTTSSLGRIYLKNMYANCAASGNAEVLAQNLEFNWIGVFFKTAGGPLDVSTAAGGLIIRLFYTYTEVASFLFASGSPDHYLYGYHNISNKGNDINLPMINEINFVVDPSFTLTGLT